MTRTFLRRASFALIVSGSGPPMRWPLGVNLQIGSDNQARRRIPLCLAEMHRFDAS
jgi:hypothetical protein